MSKLIFANNATSNLVAAISNSSTALQLTPNTGMLFPSPTSGQYFILTMTDAATGLIHEIMYGTAKSSDTITVVRGQENTTARAWLVGDYVSCYPTAGTQATFAQPDQLQQGAYSFSIAGGTANALSAAIAGDLATVPAGMPLIVQAISANTVPATLQLTIGSMVFSAVNIVKGNNSPLVANDIPASGYPIQLNYSSTFSAYVMQNPATGVSSIPAGSIAQFPCTTAPSGYLLLNGQIVSRTTYANLWTFAQASGNIVSDASWTAGQFSTGDGATTFRLPQFGGYFLRSLDNGNGIDPGRTIGSIQGSANISHTHTASSSTSVTPSSTSTASATSLVNDPGHAHSEGMVLGAAGFNGGGAYVGSGGNQFSGGGASNFGFNGSPYPTNAANTNVTVSTSVSVSTTTTASASTSTTVNAQGGSESRPINISVITCIKY